VVLATDSTEGGGMNRSLAVALLFAGAVLMNSTNLPAQTSAKTERIGTSDLKKKLESGEKFLLIDVREDYELKEDGAIAGAIHIPVAELDARMKDIPKDVQLIFY
jgi:hypothetical protein